MADDRESESYTKEQVTELLNRRIGEITAKHKAEIDRRDAQIAELQPLADQLRQQESERQERDRSAEERLSAEREKFEKRFEVMKKQIEQKEAEAQAVRGRYHSEAARRHIQALASKSGAAQSALADVAAVFPESLVKTMESESGLTVRLVDPETGIEYPDEAKVMASWLADRPHFRAAPPSGAGTGGAGPSEGGGGKNFDELHWSEQLAIGLQERHKE